MSDVHNENITDKRDQATVAEELYSAYNDGFEYFSDEAETDLARRAASVAPISKERLDEVRGELKDSEKFVKTLGLYEVRRLEYNLNLNLYRFSVEPGAAEKHERRMNNRILAAKFRSFKAWLFEHSDNKRYLRALEIDSGKASLRAQMRRDVITRKQNELVALLAERGRLNKELSSLYVERNHEYIGEIKSRKILNIRLNAAKKAYKKLSDLEQDIRKYIFAPDDKLKVFELMNHSIDLNADYAVMRYRRRIARTKEERERLRTSIIENKHKRAKIERNIGSLVAKARRRTSFYGEGGVLRWIVGIAVFAALLIALFCIFNDPLAELYKSII